MGQSGYFANTVSVGAVQDRIISKPSGSGVVQATPTIPGAVFQAAADTGPAPYYTKSSSTVLVFNMPSTPGFTSGSLAAVFWTDSSGIARYCLDATISIATDAVTVTTPGTIPAGLDNGSPAMSNFATITPGTTEVTLAIATQATSDLPANPDLTDYQFTVENLLQLILTCNSTGGFELFATPEGTQYGSSGVWLSTGPTLTVSGAGWKTNALAGLAFTIDGDSYTCTSNTATVATMTSAGSATSGTYAWSITPQATPVLYWNYAYAGNFFNWITGETAPFAGNISKLRFFNGNPSAQTMSLAALLA